MNRHQPNHTSQQQTMYPDMCTEDFVHQLK